MSFRTLILFVLAMILLTASPFAHAQGIPNTIGGLELTPSISNPPPGQDVTITARSYSVDISAATLTWTVDGKIIEKGIGSTKMTVKAPPIGKTLNISVSAVTPDGTSFVNTLALTSGAVDMIVEPNGYKPAMYPGKLPVAYQNTVKIVAVAHLANSAGVEYDPKTLLYKWEQNGNALEEASGYGKQAAILPGTLIPRPYVISVTVLTRDGNAQGVGFVSVNPVTPSVVFYRNDPLYGPLYNNAVVDTLYLGAQRETGVLAVPYGFNAPATGLGNLALSWIINGLEHPELSGNQSVTLRAPDETAGSSSIELGVTNKIDILQKASASFRAIFSASATSTGLTF